MSGREPARNAKVERQVDRDAAKVGAVGLDRVRAVDKRDSHSMQAKRSVATCGMSQPRQEISRMRSLTIGIPVFRLALKSDSERVQKPVASSKCSR